MKKKKQLKIIPTKSFFKSLSRLDKADEEHRGRERLIDEVIKQNEYLPNWRKISRISFNKHDTYRLARSLKLTKPELTIYQAKLMMSKIKWWDYSYFVDLIATFDKDTANRINQLITYCSGYGETHYKKSQTKEYKDQLNAKWKEQIENAEVREDGSTVISISDDTSDKYPLLQWSKEDKEIAKNEIKQEEKEIAQIISDWLKNNLNYKYLFVNYLDVWSRNYAKYSYNAKRDSVSRKIRKAKQYLLNNSWTELSEQFIEFLDWWD